MSFCGQQDPQSEVAIEADVAFHAALLTACRNDLLLQLGTLIGVGLVTSFRISKRFYPLSLPYHRPVAAAITTRRPGAARKRMLELLAHTFAAVERALKLTHAVDAQAAYIPRMRRDR
jgi:DNA-binding FadR family transcriptional regulator